MYFKHKITHERWTLAYYSKHNDVVTLEKGDKEGNYLTISIKEFYETFEYCWMPSK